MCDRTDSENYTDMDQYIQNRYRDAIAYYWNASKANKRWYKITRSLTIVFGALVTLIASLASSEFIINSETTKQFFALGTPVLAAILTIIAGFSQSFQWGSTWQNMVLTAQHLQKEFDKYLVTPIDKRNSTEEVEKLNSFVINESEGFFERMLGGTKPSSRNGETTNGGDSKHP